MKNLKELFKILIEEGVETNCINTKIAIALDNGDCFVFNQIELKEINGDLLYIEEQTEKRVQDYYFNVNKITHIRKIFK